MIILSIAFIATEFERRTNSMQYLIFEKANSAYIQTKVQPFESLWDAREWIKDKCLNSSYKLSDFRIFTEYEVVD